MLSYDTHLPLAADFAESHQRFWDRLAAPGSWWTAIERVAIAAEVRAAGLCALCGERRAALSPYGVDGNHDRVSELPEAAVDVVHRLVTDSGRLAARWYRSVLNAGISDGQYVEIVGTVVATLGIDSFCRAVGLPLNPLPEPEPGEPSAYRPTGAELKRAWVPLLPTDTSGSPEADLWPPNQTAYVIRAMSLVPDEVRTLKELSAVHYLPMADVGNPRAARGSLSRVQMELIAARVSALNDCFY